MHHVSEAMRALIVALQRLVPNILDHGRPALKHHGDHLLLQDSVTEARSADFSVITPTSRNRFQLIATLGII